MGVIRIFHSTRIVHQAPGDPLACRIRLARDANAPLHRKRCSIRGGVLHEGRPRPDAVKVPPPEDRGEHRAVVGGPPSARCRDGSTAQIAARAPLLQGLEGRPRPDAVKVPPPEDRGEHRAVVGGPPPARCRDGSTAQIAARAPLLQGLEGRPRPDAVKVPPPEDRGEHPEGMKAPVRGCGQFIGMTSTACPLRVRLPGPHGSLTGRLD